MGENSDIAWTDNTFNAWMGCTRKSEGCAGCYANDICVHFKHTAAFGPACTRVRTKDWSKPRAWDRKAKRDGKPTFVFAFSMADVFDDHTSIQRQWRDEFWALVKATPNLIWMVLTKRPENAHLLPSDWGNGYPNVWFGVTAENQRRADERIPLLRAIPAAKRFLSVEPMLGPVAGVDGIDWVICGGESGPRFREVKREWVVALRDECAAKGAAFFFKQWAARHPAKDAEYPPMLEGVVYRQTPADRPVGEGAAGADLPPADASFPSAARPACEQQPIRHCSDTRALAQTACQGDRPFEEDKPRRNLDLRAVLDDAAGALKGYADGLKEAGNLDKAHSAVCRVYEFVYHACKTDPGAFERLNTNAAGKPKVRLPTVRIQAKEYQEIYRAVKFVALATRKATPKGEEKPGLPEKTLQRYAQICWWLYTEEIDPEHAIAALDKHKITTKGTGILALFEKEVGKPVPKPKPAQMMIGFEREQVLALAELVQASPSESLRKLIGDAVASLPQVPNTIPDDIAPPSAPIEPPSVLIAPPSKSAPEPALGFHVETDGPKNGTYDVSNLSEAYALIDDPGVTAWRVYRVFRSGTMGDDDDSGNGYDRWLETCCLLEDWSVPDLPWRVTPIPPTPVPTPTVAPAPTQSKPATPDQTIQEDKPAS